MTRSIVAVVFTIVVLFIAARAIAGPPLITDDPYTPRDGGWEINLALTYEQLDTQRTYNIPQLDANYGLGDRVQLNVAVPFLIVDDENAGPIGGIGDTAVGAKWRFLDQDKVGFGLATFPKIVFNSPTQSVGRGLVDEGSTFILPLQIGRTFEHFDVFADLGWQFVQHADDTVYAGLAGGWHVNDKLLLLAEFHVDCDADLRRPSPIIQLGLAQTINEHLNLLFATGRSLRGGDDDPQWLAYFAFHCVFCAPNDGIGRKACRGDACVAHSRRGRRRRLPYSAACPMASPATATSGSRPAAAEARAIP